jgi:hypothetical protein
MSQFQNLEDLLSYSNSIDSKLFNSGLQGFVAETNKDEPWLAQPADADPFIEVAAIAVPVIGTESPIVSLVVPPGYDGVITHFTFQYTGGGFVNGSGELVWRIIQDGRPLPGLANITAQLGSLQTPFATNKLIIYGGQVISINIFHAANAAHNQNTIGLLSGYFYPKARG